MTDPRIVPIGIWLALALAFVAVPIPALDPEIGVNDFRISNLGPDGDALFTAVEPAIAYNAAADEYLVAWKGTSTLLGFDIPQILGQRLDGATGALIGPPEQALAGFVGPGGRPELVYNPARDQYLMAWWGPDGVGGLRLYGRRLDPAGNPLGTIFQIGEGSEAINSFAVYSPPAIAHHDGLDQYLVTWVSQTPDGDDEIVAQLLDADGGLLGANFQLSDMGPPGNTLWNASDPDAAYDGNGGYLVVWSGDDQGPFESEIYGQRLDAAGAEIGTDDFRISDMGPDGSAAFSAYDPALARNPVTGELLVVWRGDDDQGALVSGEYEIFGQRLDAAGAEIGSNDFRISAMGPDGDPAYLAGFPAVAYQPQSGDWLVAWTADDNAPPLVDNAFEVFGQRLDAAGAPVGGRLRLSDMRGDGVPTPLQRPAVAAGAAGEWMVIWQGDDGQNRALFSYDEVYGQRVDAATGLEVGANDFAVSHLEPGNGGLSDTLQAAVALDPLDDQYLVAWIGRDYDGDDLALQVYGQRLDAATGGELGGDFAISAKWPVSDPYHTPEGRPAVAYDPIANVYLVVWSGAGAGAASRVILGQYLDAASGAAIGGAFAISDPDGLSGYQPAIAFAAAARRFLVVWRGPGEVGREVEGRLVDADTGDPLGAAPFAISQTNSLHRTRNPAIAYNGLAEEFLVAWQTFGDSRVRTQRLNALDATRLGFPSMITGASGDAEDIAPALAYAPTADRYLLVWRHGGFGNVLRQVRGQLLAGSTGALVGDPFRIDEDAGGSAETVRPYPTVVWHAALERFFVAWSGDYSLAGGVDGDREIIGREVGADGALDDRTVRLSDMGPEGYLGAGYHALAPAAVYHPARQECLVVWEGSDDVGALVAGEREIFGQRLSQVPLFADGFESGTTAAWALAAGGS